MIIVALVHDAMARVRFEQGLRGEAEVRFIDSVDELSAALAPKEARLLVVQLHDRQGRPMTATIRAVRSAHPKVAIAGYAKLGAGHGADILAASRAGLNALILSEYDDVGVSLRAAMALAGADSIAERSMRRLSPGLSRGVVRIVEHYLRNGHRNMAVTEAAAALGLTRQTLSRRLTDAGLPAPGALMSWSRLMHAAHLLEDPDRSIERAAHAVGLGSATALRNMLKTYTGLLPREVREQGGLSCVLGVFQARFQLNVLPTDTTQAARDDARAA